MKIRLTPKVAEEVEYKMNVLRDSPELQKDYELTEEQTRTLVESIPSKGGVWEIPDFALATVRGELEDHANILDAEARTAGKQGDRRAAREFGRLCREMETIAGTIQRQEVAR